MRYLAVPLIVLIIGLVFLLYVWTDRRRKVRAAELREARGQRDQAITALQEVKKEVEAQVAAYPQLFFLEEMLRQKLTIVTERKELTR